MKGGFRTSICLKDSGHRYDCQFTLFSFKCSKLKTHYRPNVISLCGVAPNTFIKTCSCSHCPGLRGLLNVFENASTPQVSAMSKRCLLIKVVEPLHRKERATPSACSIWNCSLKRARHFRMVPFDFVVTFALSLARQSHFHVHFRDFAFVLRVRFDLRFDTFTLLHAYLPTYFMLHRFHVHCDVNMSSTWAFDMLHEGFPPPSISQNKDDAEINTTQNQLHTRSRLTCIPYGPLTCSTRDCPHRA